MEKQLEVVEDLVQEAEVCIKDAYYRGYEEGAKINKLSFKTNGELLNSFLKYVIDNYRIYNNEDFTLSFIYEGVIYPKEVIIKNFLLSYEND